MTVIAAVNQTALAVFAIVVGVTLIVTYFASKRVATATDFWAAGRGLTGPQNGFAIAGDYMSAASFLGIAGLIFLFGFDGFLYSVGFLVAFLTVLFLLAERMRNSGKYTIADTLAYRLKQKPARAAAALGTLSVVAFYLIAQMVGAGLLIESLVGIDFALSVILTGAFMVIYIVAGGMLATSWVQIIKAVLLMSAAGVMSVWVMSRVSWNPIDLFREARGQHSEGAKYLEPGLKFAVPLDTVSLGIGLLLGTAGLPHILMRFFTVPDAKAARSSVMWAMVLIGLFYVMTTFLGFGARAILGSGGEEAAGTARQPCPHGARLRARRRPVHGDHRRRRVRDDPGGGGRSRDLGLRRGGARHLVERRPRGQGLGARGGLGREDRRGGRSARSRSPSRSSAVPGLNVSFMVGLAFAVAASANFPALLLALTWRRFNTTGAIVGVLFGVISSVGLVIISPTVWPGPDSEGGALSWYTLTQPGLISVPLGFIGCWLGTMLSRELRAERMFDELYVRSETGLGAETGTGLTLTGRRAGGAHGGGRHHDDDAAPIAPSGTTCGGSEPEGA